MGRGESMKRWSWSSIVVVLLCVGLGALWLVVPDRSGSSMASHERAREQLRLAQGANDRNSTPAAAQRTSLPAPVTPLEAEAVTVDHRLTGRVIDEAGSPLGAQPVLAWSLPVVDVADAVQRLGNVEPDARANSGPDGVFGLPLGDMPVGGLVVACGDELRGFAPALARGDNVPVTLVRQDSATVAGLVEDQLGRPVVGARLEWVHQLHGGTQLTLGEAVVSDGTGRFELTRASWTGRSLLVEAEGFLRVQHFVPQDTADPLVVQLVSGARFRVRAVEEPSGAPLSDASLSAAPLRELPRGMAREVGAARSMRAVGDGWFELSLESDGPLLIEGRHPGRAPVAIVVKKPRLVADQVVLRFGRGDVVAGRVTDQATAQAVPGADIELVAHDAVWDRGQTALEVAARTRTDARGLFSIDAVGQGSYTLHVDADGYAAHDVPRFALSGNGELVEHEIELVAPASIHGVVRAGAADPMSAGAPAGQPLADVWVAVSPNGEFGSQSVATVLRRTRDTSTDAQGRFTFDGLQPGLQRVVARRLDPLADDVRQQGVPAALLPVFSGGSGTTERDVELASGQALELVLLLGGADGPCVLFGTLLGVVSDPAIEYHVDARWLQEEGRVELILDERTVPVDDSGVFDFGAASSGLLELVVRAESATGISRSLVQERVELRAGEQRDVTLQLPDHGVLEVLVRDDVTGRSLSDAQLTLVRHDQMQWTVSLRSSAASANGAVALVLEQGLYRGRAIAPGFGARGQVFTVARDGSGQPVRFDLQKVEAWSTTVVDGNAEPLPGVHIIVHEIHGLDYGLGGGMSFAADEQGRMEIAGLEPGIYSARVFLPDGRVLQTRPDFTPGEQLMIVLPP